MAWLWGGGKPKRAGEAQQRTTPDAVPRRATTLKAHTEGVMCCGWSPSGRQLASGSFDKTLVVWDTADFLPKEPFGLRSVIRAARTQHRNIALAEALAELDGMVGLANIKLEVAKKVNAKLKTPDYPRTHSNMLCLGPPGTGKSRAAKLIGEIFNACGLVELDAGLPPDARFVEMRTSDLIASYQGQTPKRAAEYLRQHGGKVLFYDEANAFDSAGEYAKAAATEIIRFLNDHEGKVCMIVAGERGETALHRPHAAQSVREARRVSASVRAAS